MKDHMNGRLPSKKDSEHSVMYTAVFFLLYIHCRKKLFKCECRLVSKKDS